MRAIPKFRLVLPLLLALVAGLAGPLAAQGRGFDPAGTLQELSAVSWQGDGAGDETRRLKAGILCVSWARDIIGQHWRVLDTLEGPGTWSSARQLLWNQLGWIEAFEARHLRPVIDPESQTALVETWWPGGVSTEAGSAAAMQMHGYCLELPGLLGTVDPEGPYGF